MFHRLSRRRRWLVAGTAAAAAMTCGLAAASAAGVQLSRFGSSHVGDQADGSVLLPDNQKIAPYGQRTRFTAETVGQAISPDATKVAVQTGGVASGTANLNILDASTGAILQSVSGRYDTPPVYSPDGTALYAATSGSNAILKYTVDPSTGLVTNPATPQTLTLPGGKGLAYALALSTDGSTLYAALNAANKLGVINTSTMQLVTEVPVGAAPAGVAVVGNQAFVSNRGGKIPAAGDTTNTSDGTAVDIDPTTGQTTSGTVSVVNLDTNTVTDTVNVGLQPTSLTVHDGAVFVTNSNSDTVSVVDATSHKVDQTFNVEPLPGSTVGASPNSVTFAGPNTLLVSVGGDNAIAQFGYTGPTQPVQYEGLIPTDWYPNQVSYDAATNKVFVANENGVGTDGRGTTSQVIGTQTSFNPPTNAMLGTLTGQVFDNNGWNNLPASNATGGKGGNAAGKNGKALPAIPAQLGQPSAIKHVFLIVKENRTYDQVLGDLNKGNGDPADVNYGATITPNSHSLANTFTDFDNFYNPGEQSADGNIWINEVEPNDYLYQKQATSFVRNANGQLALDPLNIQRGGYFWESALAAGQTVRLYGEDDGSVTGSYGTWQQYYADSQILEGKASGPLPVAENSMQDNTEIPAANSLVDHNFPTFNVNIPDQYRVDVWNQEFQQQLATNTVPNLTFLSLVDDHTGGVPTPSAEVADNDLAIGRLVDEISHSSVWKDSAIFVEEDDTSSGLDHVDGHRGPLFIASPYAARGVINSDYYTTIDVDKTIEQILGGQPMNQYDRAAVPMFDAFTNTPDLTPYNFVPNQYPLTEGVTGLIPLTPTAATAANPTAAAAVTATSGPAAPAAPATEQSVAAAWANWDKTVAQPTLSGPRAQRDSVNPAQLYRYDWYTATTWSKPYPGDKTILAPDQVPGRNLPTSMSGD